MACWTILKKKTFLGSWSNCGGDAAVAPPPQEHCQLPPTYFYSTWQQTRAFLKSMKNEKRFSDWFDNSEKGDVSGQLERLRG